MNRFSRIALGASMSLLSLGCVLLPVHAQGLTANDTGLNAAAQKAGYSTGLSCANQPGGCIAAFAGAAINTLTTLFGAVFLCLILYGGFMYILSRGDDKVVKKARDTIANAIIGLLIVSISYAVADFVLNTISDVTSAGSTTETTQ